MNLATPLQTFANITSARDVFEQYIVQSKSTLTLSGSAPPTVTQLPGYPAPVTIQESGWVSGYYIQGAEYQDVAILSLPTFEFAFDYTEVASDFINTAVKAGKTKLIVDLSANQGGIISNGYDTFQLLFPDVIPYIGQRIRATREVDIIGQAVSNVIDAAGGRRKLNGTVTQEVAPYISYPLYYQYAVDARLQTFPSWPSFFGPHQYYGDNFSSIFRYNLTADSTTQRPFKAENIVIVTDGQCGSTCSIFAEAMTFQGGVKTVAVGGRPTLGPMQAIGGTRGTNNIGWFTIKGFVDSIFPLLPRSLQASFNSTPLADYNNLPFTRGLKYANSVNLRDGLVQGDPTQTPLNFIYQPANCRIRQTTSMLRDVTALWKTVYDVTWKGQICASGGF